MINATPLWEYDEAVTSNTTVTENPTAGCGIILSTAATLTSGNIMSSVSGSNGDTFTLVASLYAPSETTTMEYWLCNSSVGGSSVNYTLNINASNPRFWFAQWNQPLQFVTSKGQDGNSTGNFNVSTGQLGYLVAKGPSSWPPTNYTQLGSNGSTYCGTEVYSTSDTEDPTVSTGSGILAAVFQIMSASMASFWPLHS